MLKLIPAVKHLEIKAGFLAKKAISFENTALDARLVKALNKLPVAKDGAKVSVNLTGAEGEGYTLDVAETAITITKNKQSQAYKLKNEPCVRKHTRLILIIRCMILSQIFMI